MARKQNPQHQGHEPFDVTSRLVAKLKHEEAVIAGIGNTNFDLWAAGHRPQNFYMLAAWVSPSPSPSGWRWRNRSAAFSRSRATARSLMQLGCLSTIATLQPENLCMIVMDTAFTRSPARNRPGRGRGDIVAIATGCGLSNSAWAADEEDFERLIERSLSASGPTLIGVRIDDSLGWQPPPRSRADQRAIHAGARRAAGVLTLRAC